MASRVLFFFSSFVFSPRNLSCCWTLVWICHYGKWPRRAIVIPLFTLPKQKWAVSLLTCPRSSGALLYCLVEFQSSKIKDHGRFLTKHCWQPIPFIESSAFTRRKQQQNHFTAHWFSCVLSVIQCAIRDTHEGITWDVTDSPSKWVDSRHIVCLLTTWIANVCLPQLLQGKYILTIRSPQSLKVHIYWQCTLRFPPWFKDQYILTIFLLRDLKVNMCLHSEYVLILWLHFVLPAGVFNKYV